MKNAGVMIVIKDGLILGISRRDNRSIFGLPGGKQEENETPQEAAVRETVEETSVVVKDSAYIYERMEPRRKPDGFDFFSYCYYAIDWEGEPTSSEEGDVVWLTVEELTSTKAAFPVYNRNAINEFKKKFPDIYLKGE